MNTSLNYLLASHAAEGCFCFWPKLSQPPDYKKKFQKPLLKREKFYPCFVLYKIGLFFPYVGLLFSHRQKMWNCEFANLGQSTGTQ